MGRIVFLFFVIFPLFSLCQCLDGDCQDGQGKYKFKNGTYVGLFVNGSPGGQGVFSARGGYSYDGQWVNGLKSGEGVEAIRKSLTYHGGFENNLRHGIGSAMLSDTKHAIDINYVGEWESGAICGQGELTYYREVRYGREKVLEKNHLKGSFVNGVFQGRQTSPYPDELGWEPFGLKMEDFQQHKRLTERERRRQKNPAKIEGSIILGCECFSGTLIFNASAIFRKESSWWSTEDIPASTKPIILNTRQREFDILEWYARALEQDLNKKRLPCNAESASLAQEELAESEKTCLQTRKLYTAETAWNPNRGGIKNMSPQQKWDKKILKKLRRYEKANEKMISRLKKKLLKKNIGGCVAPPVSEKISPIKKKEIQKQEAVVVEEKKSFRPQFPRANQLE